MRPIRDDIIFLCILPVILLCFLTHLSDAQRPGFGRCPDYPPMKDFDRQKVK